MIEQDVINLEHILSKNIEKFLDNGGKLISHSFGNGKDLCCAITATTRGESKLIELSRHLGTEVLHDEMFAITNGFDGTPYHKVRDVYGTGDDGGEVIEDDTLHALWTVGQNLRQKYLVKP